MDPLLGPEDSSGLRLGAMIQCVYLNRKVKELSIGILVIQSRLHSVTNN